MRNNGNNTPDPQWACVNIVNFEMGLANMRLDFHLHLWLLNNHLIVR